jgi:CRISPR/Cas system CSM-associated protein Csm3 (group 7 of RAMP superfamily)
MSKKHTHRYVARATIEFTTPFLVGAGREGDVADAIFAPDPNGLPALPGSSLAGVLRAAFQSEHGEKEADNLFGFPDRKEGKGSKLTVSWGCIHDSNGVPVEGIIEKGRLDNDDVLQNALLPTLRDHVKINHLGASDADNHGKFDEQAVCAGHRFTFELELAGTEEDKAIDQSQWNQLLAVMGMPGLRLGGKTRRGFGGFKFIEVLVRHFDLSVQEDFGDYKKHPVELARRTAVLRPHELQPQACRAKSIQMKLEPQGYWMFGGGVDLIGDADMAPVRDSCIAWDGNKGKVKADQVLIPATGIKGAIAHRVAFHYNALTGQFADGKSKEELKKIAEENPAVLALFGYCKDKPEDGQRGRVIINDMFPAMEAPKQQLVHHVGIDRFTGGARDSVLFCERPFWQGLNFDLQIDVVDAQGIKDSNIWEAFKRALNDLATGQLQVGAGAGRGNGYFKGELIWPDGLGQKGTTHD